MNEVIAVLGGGQLGRMLALAGLPLGYRFRFLDPVADSPARAAGELIVADFDDDAALEQLARDAAAVTYEFENVPAHAAAKLRQLGAKVYPPPTVLETAQDRLAEKTMFRALGIPTPEFAAVSSRDELHAAVAKIGAPCVLKTRRFGYDGKGQFVLRDNAPAAIDAAWDELGNAPGGLILESFVPFDREVSVLAARSTTGETAVYPLVENHHQNGILRLSVAPAPSTSPKLQHLAESHAQRILDHLGYVGVLAIEFFERGDELIGNEIAPRVHNSGHWTIEGSLTSQFENHLRAILGLPLGSTAMAGAAAAMVNLIGASPTREALLRLPGAHLHLYGKSPRPGRKIGHVTLVDADAARLHERVQGVMGLL